MKHIFELRVKGKIEEGSSQFLTQSKQLQK